MIEFETVARPVRWMVSGTTNSPLTDAIVATLTNGGAVKVPVIDGRPRVYQIRAAVVKWRKRETSTARICIKRVDGALMAWLEAK